MFPCCLFPCESNTKEDVVIPAANPLGVDHLNLEDPFMEATSHDGRTDFKTPPLHQNPHLMQPAIDMLRNLSNVTELKTHMVQEEEMRWMNFVMQVMWPNIRQVIKRRAGSEMLDRAHLELNRHSEVSVSELSIEFDPGSVPPTLSRLYIYKKKQMVENEGKEFSGLQLDFTMNWVGGPDFVLKPKLKGTGPGGMSISVQNLGVSGFSLSGTASVILAPLIDEEPCFGASQCFFLDQPEVEIKLAGIDHAWIKRLIHLVVMRVTTAVLAENFVLPHRLVVKARKDVPLETMITIKSPLPVALLEVEVLAARDLIGLDPTLVGKPTSDPFVTIRVGDCETRTSTQPHTVNPTWSDGPDYLPVFNLAQVVKVQVFDDDVLTEDDFIGKLSKYSVFKLCQECSGPEGAWLPLTALKGKKAGEIRIRTRFLRVEPIRDTPEKFQASIDASTKSNCPYLLTVKLLGMEGERTMAFQDATCSVTYTDIVPDQFDTERTAAPREATPTGFAKMTNAVRSGFGKLAAAAASARSITGWGFGSQYRAMSTTMKSSKAVPWAQAIQKANSANNAALPPTVARAIEHLHYREGWDFDKIASMFGLSVAAVQSAAKLRANFQVAWHQALHFLVLPGKDPLSGTVEIEVSLPRRVASANLVRRGSKLVNVSDGATDANGRIGTVRLNLSQMAPAPDLQWKRCVRARLRRPDLVQDPELHEQMDALRGDSQCDATIGDPVAGVLTEFMVELRPVAVADPTESLDSGQAVLMQYMEKEEELGMGEAARSLLLSQDRSRSPSESPAN